VFVGYEKLDKPEVVHIVSSTSSVYNKASSYFGKLGKQRGYLYQLDKCPSRTKGQLKIDVDIDASFIDNYFLTEALDGLKHQFNSIMEYKSKNWSYNIYPNINVGLSSSPDSYDTPEEIKKLIDKCGLVYKE
jgi:hypothetical protein